MVNAYLEAKIDIDYKIVTFQSSTRAMYSEELTPNAEMLSLPNYLFQWGTKPFNNKAWLLTHTGKQKAVTEDELQEQFVVGDTIKPNPDYNELTEEEAPSRRMHGFDYVITWFNMPSIPSAYLNVNMVNYGPVYSPSLGVIFPSGTLLLNSSRAGRTVSFGGANRYQIETRWSFNPMSWNKFWRVRSMQYEELYLKGTSNQYYNFPSTNFSGLLP